jgi:adenosylmethionine-8-amino-7-oxononanoate aminotransferase
MLCSGAIYEAIENGSGFFQHGHTYMGHPVAAAAGLAVLDAIEKRDLLANVRDKGDKLHDALTQAFAQHPHVGDIRGRGLFRAVEFVEDRAAKKPFDPKLGVHKKLKQAAFEAGLICYPMGGTIDGRNGDHVLLAPPFIIEDKHIDEIVTKLDQALRKII